MTTNNLISAIKAVITEHCPTVFFGISRPQYPKIDVDLREVTVDYGVRRNFLMTLDYYNDNGSYANLNDLADSVGAALDFTGDFIRDGLVTIKRTGNRFAVGERTSEKIVQITERFEVKFYERVNKQ